FAANVRRPRSVWARRPILCPDHRAIVESPGAGSALDAPWTTRQRLLRHRGRSRRATGRVLFSPYVSIVRVLEAEFSKRSSRSANRLYRGPPTSFLEAPAVATGASARSAGPGA